MASKAILFAALLAGSAAWTPARALAQDFDVGLSAYNQGDFSAAFGQWWPLSMRGDGKAQAALGYLYYKGLGVRSDAAAAALWFARAADKGQPTAQYFLGTLYLSGRGVEQDFARAHMWCDIAMTSGFSDGLGCRDAATARMRGDDAARAARLLAEWRRNHRR